MYIFFQHPDADLEPGGAHGGHTSTTVEDLPYDSMSTLYRLGLWNLTVSPWCLEPRDCQDAANRDAASIGHEYTHMSTESIHRLKYRIIK